MKMKTNLNIVFILVSFSNCHVVINIEMSESNIIINGMQGLTKYTIYSFVIFHWPKLLFSFVYYQVVENYTNSYEFSKIFYSHSIFLSDIFFCLWAKVSWHLALETITKNSISNRKCWLFRSVFFNLVWFTAPLRTKNIWWHLNAPKMTIWDTLNSKVLIKDSYYIKLYVNSLFGGTPGTSSQHPCVPRHPGWETLV